MKKAISVLLVSMLALMSVASVTAFGWYPPQPTPQLPQNPFGGLFMVGYTFVMPLEQKDPSDWSIVAKKGTLMGNSGLQLAAMIYRVKPNTDYTLIYYGDETHNDVWPYATCIASARTNWYGGAFMMGTFDYRGFVGDGVGQKFWVVPSEDLDCDAGKFVAWNPEDILFEHDVI